MTERLLLVKDDKVLDCKKINLVRLNCRFIDKFGCLPKIINRTDLNYRYIDVSDTYFTCWNCIFKKYCVKHSPPSILEAEGVFLEEDIKLLMELLPNVFRNEIIKALSKNGGDLVETVLNIDN